MIPEKPLSLEMGAPILASLIIFITVGFLSKKPVPERVTELHLNLKSKKDV